MAILLLATLAWLTLVAVWFRTSKVVLIGGLLFVAATAAILASRRDIAPSDVGLFSPDSWASVLGLSVGSAVSMLLLTPVADRLATWIFVEPPRLEAFRIIKESRLKLVAGIVFAWIAGAFLEELALRGILLRATRDLIANYLTEPAAVVFAVFAAAGGAFIIHLYQGPRAAFIIAQLSVLFGVIFVVGGENLWTVVLAHGFYDTVAFIRFANGSSKYSELDLRPSEDTDG